jgi:hypothetical protein
MAIENVTQDMLDPGTPAEVVIQAEARKPQMDPTCGKKVAPPPVKGMPRHRLVTIGDSLTHGFQSGAILHTEISWPRIVAYEMGWDTFFRYPKYHDPNGSMPFNLEVLIRELESKHGNTLSLVEKPFAVLDLVGMLARLDHWWADNWQLGVDADDGIPHNLAVWGWDLRDCLEWTADRLARRIKPAQRHYWRNVNTKSGWRVLEPARNRLKEALTVFEAAAALGREGTSEDPSGPGIETLVVMLGSNNALGTVVKLGRPIWSEAGDGKKPAYKDVDRKGRFTVWRPSHFKEELAEVVAQVRKIKAQHVIWGTVPHVTIAPIAKGVGRDKSRPRSRYFPYYCRPWVRSEDFDPREDRHLTAQQARAIDSAIDQYNEAIEEVVTAGRGEGRDWYLLDVAGMLDRLAGRRYLDDPSAVPTWWGDVGGPYPLPPELQALKPPPSSRFFQSGPNGRVQGGLFSLDGVHPTTIGYGLVAQEVIKVMELAGVQFHRGDEQEHVRPGPVRVDFNRLIAMDSLISQPPQSLREDLHMLG